MTKVRLLTGAGSGIGAVVAERLIERGDELWLLARDAGRARELARRFPGARTLVGDLAEPARLSWALGQQSPPDRLDALLHIAGMVELGAVGDLTPKIWQETLAVNVVGPAELTRLLLPQLRLSRGHVVFANAGAGLQAKAEWSAYAASKHALRALADALREEESAQGIRVTSLYPGRTATPMQQKVHQQEGKPYDASRWIPPESVATALLTALDLPPEAELTNITIRPTP
ncbi:SDR family oxidoreductase [Streptomyces sp. CA-111067]|uniref:SDR family oxidoreductase n=1 Tax=Streptomyces sp. CA-111067 TaxID=3240046 RepID=UPI003D989E3E